MKAQSIFSNLLCSVVFLTVSLTYSSCSKMENPDAVTPSSQKEQGVTISELMTDSVFVTDTLPNRVFTVYNICRDIVGTITVNSQEQLRYYSQTTSTITLIGTATLALNKNTDYWFSPSSCTTGNRYLKVKFASGTQTLCSTFTLNNCTWSYSSGGCTIISTHSFVSVLPTPC